VHVIGLLTLIAVQLSGVKTAEWRLSDCGEVVWRGFGQTETFICCLCSFTAWNVSI